MARSLAAIEKEILELDLSSQEEILRVLVAALDGAPDSDVENAWIDEARRRSAEIDAAAVECIPAEQVFERLDKQLKK